MVEMVDCVGIPAGMEQPWYVWVVDKHYLVYPDGTAHQMDIPTWNEFRKRADDIVLARTEQAAHEAFNRFKGKI